MPYVTRESSASLLGNGSPSSLSNLVLQNRGAIIAIVTGSFLGILLEFDQPYEILICVLLVLMILMSVGGALRDMAISMTSPKSVVWRKALLSYVDFLSVAVIMFTTQYATNLIQTEWEKVGYTKRDTLIVGLFLILMFIGFLVFFTAKPEPKLKQTE